MNKNSSENKSLKERWKSGEYDYIQPLRKKLLNIGGDEVVPNREEQADEFIQNGSVINFESIMLVNGRSSQCHSNSCLLYQQNEEITHIGTGWALSEDGLWRQHSWAMKNKNTLVETTLKREVYYGLLLTGEEADEFIKNVAF